MGKRGNQKFCIVSPKFPPDTGTFDLNDDSYAEFHFVLDLTGADAGHQVRTARGIIL